MNDNRKTKKQTLGEVAASEISNFLPEEAECALLGSMILDSRVIPDVQTIIRSSDTLFKPAHVLIYEAIIAAGDNGFGMCDIVKLTEHLKAAGNLDTVGGVDYLVYLSECVPSPTGAPYYAKRVQDARDNLACYEDVLTAAKLILTAPGDSKDVIAGLEAKLLERRAQTTIDAPETAGVITAREAERAANGGIPPGIECGFPGVDELTGGLYPSEMTIVGARPSIGKTAVAIRTLLHAAKLGYGCLFFSLEMSKLMIAHRFLSYMTGIGMPEIRKGNLDHQRKIDLQEAAEQLRSLPLYIDDRANSPSLIRARTRQMIAKLPVRLIVIDYLQFVQPDPKKEGYGTRDNEVGTMSRAFKSLAKDTNSAVMLLSQLNRGAESRDGHKPRISDLRESGSIEQDADVVWLLHQEDYYHRDDANYDKDYIGEINIAKQRNGSPGVVKVDLCRHTGQWLGTSDNYGAKVFGNTEKRRRA
jgi:replicative DNA helicase